MLFVCSELQKLLQEHAQKSSENSARDINKTVGFLIEIIIDEYIKPEYNTEIHTVGRVYVIGKRRGIGRPALMYCLRKTDRVKSIKLHWEDKNG